MEISQKRLEANKRNALKGGRPVTSATLKTQMARERLATIIEEEFDELVRPQLEKAKEGDIQAFNSLWDKAIIKPPTESKSEIKNVKEYRLNDAALQEKAKALVELQKNGTTGRNKGNTGT